MRRIGMLTGVFMTALVASVGQALGPVGESRPVPVASTDALPPPSGGSAAPAALPGKPGSELAVPPSPFPSPSEGPPPAVTPVSGPALPAGIPSPASPSVAPSAGPSLPAPAAAAEPKAAPSHSTAVPQAADLNQSPAIAISPPTGTVAGPTPAPAAGVLARPGVKGAEPAAKDDVLPAPRQASTPAPTGPQMPTVYLEKVGPAAVPVGKPLTYQIIARNTGAIPLMQVRVEDEIPAGARFVTADPRPEVQGTHLVWKFNSLDRGTERRIEVEIQPGGEGEITSTALVTFSAASGMKTQVTRPKVTMSQLGPETVPLGDPAVFQIQVSNEGTGPATGLALHAHLPAGLWHDKGSQIDADLGTLAPKETRVLSLQTTAIRAGRQVNEITLTGDDGIQATNQAAVLVTEAVLSVRQAGPQRRFLNREVVFDIEVANSGTGSASNLIVTDALPQGLEFVAATDGGVYEPASRAVAWRAGALNPGERKHVAVKAVATAVGDLVNQARVQADRGLDARADLAVHVEGIAALLMEVANAENPVEVGAEAVYQIRVVNQGTAPATGVQVIATLPDGLLVKSAAGSAPFRVQGQQVIFENLAQLNPRTDALFRVHAAAQRPGDMRFKVQLSSDQMKLPICQEESTQVYSDRETPPAAGVGGVWRPESAQKPEPPAPADGRPPFAGSP